MALAAACVLANGCAGGDDDDTADCFGLFSIDVGGLFRGLLLWGTIVVLTFAATFALFVGAMAGLRRLFGRIT
jgi:hypothetical protein